MQRERERMSDFFGGFGSGGRMFPSLFGGRNPFDDPFFSRPFGGLFESGMFGPSAASSDAHEGNIEKGIVIEELDSDHEEDNGGEDSKRCKEPSVEHPDDDVADGKSKGVIVKSEPYKAEATKPQNRTYSVHSCKVTYGGVNGAYYKSTRTTKAGSDGVVIEETKEADKTTGQAQHRISRGIHNKGHSVTRKLNADGKVDTLQTLHNLNEDELAGFEEAWNSNKKGVFPCWDHGFDTHGLWGSEHRRNTTSGGWFLPSSEETQSARWMGKQNEAGSTGGRTKKVVRINIE